MQETIERFYAAFDRRDGDAMAACYARGARFSDPAFGELRAERRSRRGPHDLARRLLDATA